MSCRKDVPATVDITPIACAALPDVMLVGNCASVSVSVSAPPVAPRVVPAMPLPPVVSRLAAEPSHVIHTGQHAPAKVGDVESGRPVPRPV